MAGGRIVRNERLGPTSPERRPPRPVGALKAGHNGLRVTE